MSVYENDYSLNWEVIATWLAIAAVGGGLLAIIKVDSVRKRLTAAWTLFPAIFVVAVCVYALVATDYDWFVPILAAPILLILLLAPWAASALLAYYFTRRICSHRQQSLLSLQKSKPASQDISSLPAQSSQRRGRRRRGGRS